jgi:hypothetical protein
VTDSPRWLARGAGGYTAFAGRSIDPGAECVDEDEQRRQTQEAHLRASRRGREEWLRLRRDVDWTLNGMVASGLVRRHDLRPIRHELERLDRRVINGASSVAG